jgi:hypothetical protein
MTLSELDHMAEHFFGYGRWDAPFWFIDSEAALDSAHLVSTRSATKTGEIVQ